MQRPSLYMSRLWSKIQGLVVSFGGSSAQQGRHLGVGGVAVGSGERSFGVGVHLEGLQGQARPPVADQVEGHLGYAWRQAVYPRHLC